MIKPLEIKHLYLRAGFGLSPLEWQEKKGWTRQQALNDLFEKKAVKSSFAVPVEMNQMDNTMMQMVRVEKQKIERKLLAKQNADWVARMADPNEDALIERMSLFWHGHFACETKNAYLAAQQLNSIRENALGSFRKLVVAIAKDPSMIQYLNNQQNRKFSPNENFARELMELFTIGIGNYTEKDVKEAARAFTGWKKNKEGDFVYKKRVHDFDTKEFMGQTGDFDGEDIINIILEKKETAVFITRKIYKYFVNEQINEQRINQLANEFYDTDYDIGKLMYSIFSSDWFYEVENIGTKIKSPVEFMAGMMRTLNLKSTKPKGIIKLQSRLGQILFKPPNVAGWLGGKNWIDNSTLMVRLNLATYVVYTEKKQKIKGFKPNQFSFDIEPLVAMTSDLDKRETLDLLSNFLLQNASVDFENFRNFIPQMADRTAFVKRVCVRLMSLPEYQMC